MNKAIKYTLLALAALCLFISCNIDSTEGLIQAAATAVNVIDYNTTNVIGRSDNALYVTTDKGICKIDSNGNYTVVKEGGNLAKKAIWANESEYAYFNSENNKYITEKYDGTAVSSTLFNEFDGYTLKSSFSNDCLLNSTYGNWYFLFSRTNMDSFLWNRIINNWFINS